MLFSYVALLMYLMLKVLYLKVNNFMQLFSKRLKLRFFSIIEETRLF
ncbi:hypothetical protein BCP6_013 [Bacillus phage BCP6]|nr:hypothetical protein BCP6_013 [Bacillus phage BCP6]